MSKKEILIDCISLPSFSNILPLILSILTIYAHTNILQPNGEEKIYKDDLEAALAGASTKNSTVIIAVANQAYTEGDKPMLDIFLDGLWLGEGTQKLKDHILIVAVDQTAYDRCKFLKLHCYKMKTDGVEFDGGEKLFMSDDFIKMMWRRTLLLGDVLKHGYNFIFTVSF